MGINIEALLKRVRQSSYSLPLLSTKQKNNALKNFSTSIKKNFYFLLGENEKDLKAQKGKISEPLYQRLKLDRGKLVQLVEGIEDVISLPDPVGRVLMRTKLDKNLILEKTAVPIGVLGIVFESRPDVIPQILSLALKSGNAAILKGGKEAFYSNRAFMALVKKLNQTSPYLPSDWVWCLETREAFRAILNYPQYVDLVIPRGSYGLVKSIMESTKIPVLGHSEGICHLYVHSSADLNQAIQVVIDSKVQYPAACNALETLLVDKKIAKRFLPLFFNESQKRGIGLKGCPETRKVLRFVKPAAQEDWSTEYGDLRLSVRVVPGIKEAMVHINHYGSHHTDGILAENRFAQNLFFKGVDSASVFSNVSTRFADGFRFGLGGEVGISTAKIHCRGPVGLEGLSIYKYELRGKGHLVSNYIGEYAKPFLHQSMKIK